MTEKWCRQWQGFHPGLKYTNEIVSWEWNCTFFAFLGTRWGHHSNFARYVATFRATTTITLECEDIVAIRPNMGKLFVFFYIFFLCLGTLGFCGAGFCLWWFERADRSVVCTCVHICA